MIPDGGHAEVEWGVRHKTATSDIVHGAGNEKDARWRAAQPHTPDCAMTLVAREITYGPWLPVEP